MNNWDIDDAFIYHCSLALSSFSTSSSFGNLPALFFEKISSLFNLTSKTPPEDGINVREDILFLCFFNNLSERPTAFER